MAEPVLLLGEAGGAGTYLLRILLREDLRLRFGRFDGGREIAVSAGAYAYVGSALGRGSSGLGRRLVRHASRSEGRPAHRLRGALLGKLIEAGVAGSESDLLPRGAKRLHWHVDYLLDREAAHLDRVLAIRSERRLEGRIAGELCQDAETRPLAAGLGASDSKGATHLLRVPQADAWWNGVVSRAQSQHSSS